MFNNNLGDKYRTHSVVADWHQDYSFCSELNPVSCIEYDPFFDILWIGYANGRVSTFNISTLNNLPQNEEQFVIDLEVYSSFHSVKGVANTSPSIYQILPNNVSVLALNESFIGIHSYGGLTYGSINFDDPVLDNSQKSSFTCATLIRPPVGKDDTSSQEVPSVSNFSLVGTNGTHAFLHDLSRITTSGRDNYPLIKYSLRCPTVKVTGNGYVAALAGQDGGISLLDAKLRSPNVVAHIEGHPGAVTDLALDATDGGRTLYTCGFTRRAINPYDPNSPFQYFCDPVVRIFDLRMHRQLGPFSIPPMPISSSTGVRFIRFIRPDANKVSSSGNPYLDKQPPSLLLSSEDGILQINDIDQSGGGLIQKKLFFASVASDSSSPAASITSAAVSSTGNFLSVGLSSGCVIQYFREGDLKVNSNSPLVKTVPPRKAPSPALSLPADALVLGTAYTLCQTVPTSQRKIDFNDMESFLSSSYSLTPGIYHQKLKLTSARRIHEDLKVNLTKQDFIGTIPNPEFYPNSMLYGLLSKKAYAVCDPRKQTQSKASENGSTNRRSSSTTSDDYNIPSDHNSGSSNAPSLMEIPAHFRRQRAPRGKQRIKKFEYSRYNDTAFIGLENNLPNSYVNAILQLLYSVPSIRNEALRSQTSSGQHINPTALWCELGFLFHMILSVQNYFRREDLLSYSQQFAVDELSPAFSEPQKLSDNNRGQSFSNFESSQVDKVVQPANFQRTFQLVPEAVALGLFDGTVVPASANLTGSAAPRGRSHSGSTGSEKQDADLQQTSQTFLRFILTQLNKEIVEAESSRVGGIRAATNVIDNVFGFYVKSCTTFQLSGVTETASNAIQSLSLELIYSSSAQSKTAASNKPGIKSPPKPNDNNLNRSFSSILRSSLQKETFMKGWCSVSETYEPFKQTRSLLSLPHILTILCGDTKREAVGSAVDSSSPPDKAKTKAKAKTIQSVFWASYEVYVSKCDENFTLAISDDIAGPHLIKLRSWLPEEVEIAFVNPKPEKSTDDGKLIVSSRISVENEDASLIVMWIISDGLSEILSSVPASEKFKLKSLDETWVVESFDLMAVVSQILSSEESQVILHARVGDEAPQWVLFNDFLVRNSAVEEVLQFPSWRHPCVVCFNKKSSEDSPSASVIVRSTRSASIEAAPEVVLPESVLSIPSLSQTPCVKLVSSVSGSPASKATNAVLLPEPGDLIAFDGEFVTVALEQSQVSANGQRVVSDEGRQILARMTLLHGGKPDLMEEDAANAGSIRLLADDYILPLEPVLDYVTRFSGILAEDLNPLTSKHALLTHRAAYLKLRYFVDRKFLFVGHGLEKDFETANIFVPPEQIIDTVDLWRLPNQRKISLRFLASYLLKQDIQDEIHDSIEDAKTALLLYRHYQRVSMRGPDALKAVLNDLYSYGHKNNWTIGLEKIPTY